MLILRYVLIIALPGIVCASKWIPSKAASDLTTVQTCNAVSTQNTFAPQKLENSTATTGSWAFSQVKSSTQNFELYTNANFPNNTSWASGTWTIQIDVTIAASANMTWEDTCVIRVNSSGVAQTTEGSTTAQAISLNTTGTKSMNVTQSATDSSASATDRIVIVMNFKNASSTTTRTFTLDAGVVANEFVTAPTVAKLTGTATDGTLSESMARVHGWVRTDSDTALSAESPARVFGAVRSDSDTTLSAESDARVFGAVRSGSDGTLSETAARSAIAFARTGSDAGVLTETASRASIAFTRTDADSAFSSETGARSAIAFNRSGADAALSSESALRGTIAFLRSSSDGTVVESMVRQPLAFIRIGADGSVTETVARQRNVPITISDGTLSASVGRTAASFRTASDGTLSESVNRGSLVLARTTSDGSLSETLATNSAYVRTVVADGSTTESVVRLAASLRNLSDGSLAESIISNGAFSRAMFDGSLGESLATVSSGGHSSIYKTLCPELHITPAVWKANIGLWPLCSIK